MRFRSKLPSETPHAEIRAYVHHQKLLNSESTKFPNSADPFLVDRSFILIRTDYSSLQLATCARGNWLDRSFTVHTLNRIRPNELIEPSACSGSTDV